jgi:hypothetical protein
MIIRRQVFGRCGFGVSRWMVSVFGLLVLFVFCSMFRASHIRTDGFYTYHVFQSPLIRLLLLFSVGFDNAIFQFSLHILMYAYRTRVGACPLRLESQILQHSLSLLSTLKKANACRSGGRIQS